MSSDITPEGYSRSRIIGGIYYPYCPLMMSDISGGDGTVMLINGHKIPYKIFKTWPYMDTQELFEEFAELRGYTKATGTT
jgi:hypothetical protein